MFRQEKTSFKCRENKNVGLQQRWKKKKKKEDRMTMKRQRNKESEKSQISGYNFNRKWINKRSFKGKIEEGKYNHDVGF